MSIGFSKNWSYFSIAKSKGCPSDWTVDKEKALIELMILKCDQKLVKDYAANDKDNGLDVYVRTGVHKSKSEGRYHVQAVMGGYDPKNPGASSPGEGFTVHIIWDLKNHPDGPFEAHIYPGQPHLKRVESTGQHKGGGSDGGKKYTSSSNRGTPY